MNTLQPHCGVPAFPYCDLLAEFFRTVQYSDMTRTIYETLDFLRKASGAHSAFYVDRLCEYVSPSNAEIVRQFQPFATELRLIVLEAQAHMTIDQLRDRALQLWREPYPLEVAVINLPQQACLGVVGLCFKGGIPHHTSDSFLKDLEGIARIVLSRALDQSYLTTLSGQRQLQVNFLKEVLSVVGNDYDNAYATLLAACDHLIPSRHSVIWLVNQESETLTLRAQRGAEDVPLNPVLKIRDSLTGQAWLKNSPLFFPDLQAPECLALFKAPAKASVLGLRQLVLIPVRGKKSTLREDIEAILSIFTSDLDHRFQIEDLNIISTEIGAALTIAKGYEAEAILRELTIRAQQSKDLSSYLYRVANYLKELMRVEGVSIFVWNEVKQRIELGNTTGLDTDKRKSDIYYQRDEGKTGQIFSTGGRLVIQEGNLSKLDRESPPKYVEKTRNPPLSFLGVPIFGVEKSGKPSTRGLVEEVPIGVIRCVNKLSYVEHEVDLFSSQDIARLERAARMIAPHVQILQAEQARVALLSRISHEILSPVISIRGTAEHMLQRGEELSTAEARSLANDIFTHGTILRMLSEGINIANATAAGLKTYRKRDIDLVRQVISPCIDMAKPLARSEGLPFNSIVASGPAELRCETDRLAIQQVIFNLLTNAIKYHDRSAAAKSKFAVRVVYERRDDKILIRVLDHGMGIDKSDAPLIFDYGYRGRKMHRWDVKGIGLGLYISKTIAKDLGGSLDLESPSKPTIFRLTLPVKATKI